MDTLQDGIMLSQRKYAEDLVTQACLRDQKVAHKPMEINHHFSALLRIIRYVQSKINRGFFLFSISSLNLERYADWAECPNSWKPTTRCCMLIRSSLVSWKCKKQPKISKSSTEAEYRSMLVACSEIVWIRR
ncbi:hypothetical protein H5410_047155 [Solanum commersonii]|uniref:Mitochondrial protein n=1 Tax=Solanum commersonii TaxID=4109 RepID=A0A9J5XE94_SOLCO|nr:hypothetical protein H5410_047155 [Solanum commersonii]